MDYLTKPGSPEELLDELTHYGIKGMKWGVRRTPEQLGHRPEGVPRKTNREARKDAREWTKAKMFYGEGAGNRRKLINNTVAAKSKRDPAYKKAFDAHVESTNMAKRASQARGERKRKDVRSTTARTARGFRHTLMGNPQYATATAALLAGGYMYAKKNGIDKIVVNNAKVKYSQAKQAYQTMKVKQNLRSYGFKV